MSQARTTLGFCGLVYRRAAHDESNHGGRAAADYLDADPKLPVRFFRNLQLDGTRVERGFFRCHELVDLIGPLPELSPDGRLSLAEQLVDPFWGRSGTPLRRPDQVVHMSCHHGVRGDPETASALSLLLSESVELRKGR